MEVRGVTAGKGSTLFISNEDIDDIIGIVKPVEKSGVLINGVTKMVKEEIKNNNNNNSGKVDFLVLY